jgi:antitoxin CptB
MALREAGGAENEPREARIKRLRMRSMRRGTKEMDLLLMRFTEARLDAMSDADLALYDALLRENDQDLYQWIAGQAAPPEAFAELVARIASVPAPQQPSARPS